MGSPIPSPVVPVGIIFKFSQRRVAFEGLRFWAAGSGFGLRASGSGICIKPATVKKKAE